MNDEIRQSPTFIHTLNANFSFASNSASRDCLLGIWDLVKGFFEYCTLDKSIKIFKLLRNSNKYQCLIRRTDVDQLIQNNIRQNWNNYQLGVYYENTSLLFSLCGQHFQNIYLRSTLKINPRCGHKLCLNNAKYSTLMARSKDNFLLKHAYTHPHQKFKSYLVFSYLAISLFKASEETEIKAAKTWYYTSISTSAEFQNVAVKISHGI